MILQTIVNREEYKENEETDKEQQLGATKTKEEAKETVHNKSLPSSKRQHYIGSGSFTEGSLGR